MVRLLELHQGPDNSHAGDNPVALPDGHPAAATGEVQVGDANIAPAIDHLTDRIPVGSPVGRKGEGVEDLKIHVAMPMQSPNRTPWLEQQLSRLPGGSTKVVLASGHNIDPSVQTAGFMDALAGRGRTVFAPVHATESKWENKDFGRRGMHSEPDTLDSGAGSVIATLEAYALDGEKIPLVGHSLGALEVLIAAIERGEQVESVTLISPPFGDRQMSSLELAGRAGLIVFNEGLRLWNLGRGKGPAPTAGAGSSVKSWLRGDAADISKGAAYDPRKARMPRLGIDINPDTAGTKAESIGTSLLERTRRLGAFVGALSTSAREIFGGQKRGFGRFMRSMGETSDIGQSVDAGPSFFLLLAAAKQGIPIKILLPPGPRGGTKPGVHNDALRGDEFFDGAGVMDTVDGVNSLIDAMNDDILHKAAEAGEDAPLLIPRISYEVVAPEPHHLGGGHNFILGDEETGMAGVAARAVDRSIAEMHSRRVTPYGFDDGRGLDRYAPDQELRRQIERDMRAADRAGRPYAGDTSGVYGSQDAAFSHHPTSSRSEPRQSRRSRHRESS